MTSACSISGVRISLAALEKARGQQHVMVSVANPQATAGSPRICVPDTTSDAA